MEVTIYILDIFGSATSKKPLCPSIGLSVIISLIGSKLHFHAPIGTFVQKIWVVVDTIVIAFNELDSWLYVTWYFKRVHCPCFGNVKKKTIKRCNDLTVLKFNFKLKDSLARNMERFDQGVRGQRLFFLFIFLSPVQFLT